MYRFHNYLSLILILTFGTISKPLLSQSKDSLSVYVFLLDECRICQEVAPYLNEVYEITKQKNIGFVGIFPNYASTESGVIKFSKKYRVKFPLKTDHSKVLAKSFEATVLPEVILYNEDKKEVIYRGLIHNLFYAPGKRRHKITEHYLKNAIFATVEDKLPETSQTEAIGCYINYSENPF